MMRSEILTEVEAMIFARLLWNQMAASPSSRLATGRRAGEDRTAVEFIGNRTDAGSPRATHVGDDSS